MLKTHPGWMKVSSQSSRVMAAKRRSAIMRAKMNNEDAAHSTSANADT